MAGRSFNLPPSNRKKLALILIIIGSILTVTGIILFLMNIDSSDELAPFDGSEQISDVINSKQEETASSPDLADTTEASSSDESEMVETTPSTEPSKDTTENLPVEPVLDSFTDDFLDPKGSTYMMSDGSVQEAGEVPNFHAVSLISSKIGVNPKTNEISEDLYVFLSALPDREMSISVLVSTDSPDISGTTPDFVQGLQWILTYSGGEFKKTARSVSSEGTISQLDAEHFNIRFIGNVDTAEVEFFGPPGTKYYAVMIYDETYFTLIRP